MGTIVTTSNLSMIWLHHLLNRLSTSSVSSRSACRHGDRCSRLHNRPTISPTLLLPNLYQNPALNAPPGPDGLPMPVDARKSQEHFEVWLRPLVTLHTAFPAGSTQGIPPQHVPFGNSCKLSESFCI